MPAMKIVANIILIIVELFLIAVVLLQPSKEEGLPGSISGGADTFFGKNKAKSYEGKLAFLTKVCAVIFMVFSILAVLLQK